MKKCFSRYRLALFALSMVSLTIFAEQIWKGTNVSSVIDEDLVIQGNISLPLGCTKIKAIQKDVTVHLTRDSTINGNWAGASQLYLVAAEGRTIRFQCDYNITFVGSGQGVGADLLVIQSGPGTVDVAIGEGKKFEIGSCNCSGGVQWYVLMYGGMQAPIDEYACEEYCNINNPFISKNCCEEYCDEYSSLCGKSENSADRPTLRFIRLESSSCASNKNRQIVIGEHSLMSFLSSRKVKFAHDSAFIKFDAAMDGLGRMILEIKDTGAFIAAGHYTSEKCGEDITADNIERGVAAGYQATWSVFNSIGSNAAAGLLVLDKNSTLSELLQDPFLNLHTRTDYINYRGLFCGQRFGVILGANGVLSIESNSYLDFVGLSRNALPSLMIPGFENVHVSKLLKMRNPSAFIVDGSNDPCATSAQIIFGESSAFFLRSGVADNGEIRDISDADPFTIDAAERTRGAGNIVLDVEGELVVRGAAPRRSDPVNVSSKIELLSLEVVPTGGSLFVESGDVNFPLRTFNKEDGELLQYNSGAFLINNRMNLYNTALSHTDEGHNVVPCNSLRSEPTYIGGEAFKLLCSDERPSIRFFNSVLNVNTDIALTGLDLVVSNLVEEGIILKNLVDFVFYSNGACIDNGTGRQMILGTRIGSTAADGCTRIDSDAHIDIMEQDNAVGADIDPLDPDGDQTLDLRVADNDITINNLITDTTKKSIHTIFLGNSSNISIGVNADSTGFNIDTHPKLRIAGNFFSFTTKDPCANRSNLTGKAGIFVDLNGELTIEPQFIAYFCVTVTKSHNGIVNLPPEQVFFCDCAGIATWNVDLSNPNDQIIAGPDQILSTYIFNWILAKKDCTNFSPFEIDNANSCECPPVTQANVTSLPTVQGTVDNLLIEGSRIGDPAQFLIDGGFVRQLSFSDSQCNTAVPTAVIVLRNEGRIGLSTPMTFGVNGISVIADGSGQVVVNEDMVIDNTCAFIKGPNFGPNDSLQLYSAVPREIRLKSTGTLDLTSFDQATDLVQLTGELRLVVEPGATIITGLGTFSFANNSQLLFEPSIKAFDFFSAIPFGAIDNNLAIELVNADQPHNELSSLANFGQGLNNTDEFRVKLAGQGVIQFQDNAQGILPFNAFVGVETINKPMCQIPTTNLELRLLDNATFAVGHFNYNEGGVLQIGNVADFGPNHSVGFALTLNGDAANFTIGSRGFVGLGVGIERFDGLSDPIPGLRKSTTRSNPPANQFFIPNRNIVNNLYNVGTITFNFFNGRFEHDRIASGDNTNASLLGVSGAEGISFDLNFELPDENINPDLIRASNFNVAGGGNMVLINPGDGGVQPVVLTQDGVITPRLSAGIMASSLLQTDNVDTAGLSGAQFFDYFKTHDAVTESNRPNTFGRANAAAEGDSFRPEFVNIMVDTVSNGVIVRGPVFDIIGAGQNDSKRRSAIDSAAVFVNISSSLNEILTVTNIGN